MIYYIGGSEVQGNIILVVQCYGSTLFGSSVKYYNEGSEVQADIILGIQCIIVLNDHVQWFSTLLY